MIGEILDSFAAPFVSQVGWQGFAYGLLGLKTIRKVVTAMRDFFDEKNSE